MLQAFNPLLSFLVIYILNFVEALSFFKSLIITYYYNIYIAPTNSVVGKKYRDQ